MSPPSPLTRRPQATAFSIEDLLDRVRRGEVRIPEFQRSFQWMAKDIHDLLDSVYRGYPIGSLLFWKREGPATLLHIGPVRIDAPHTAQALWAVDGQQRITALTGVLLHPSLERAHDDFAFYFDLETEKFVQHSRKDRLPAHWLPMNLVLDSEQLLDWLARYLDRTEKPQHTRTAMKLGRALREYQVPAYIVEADEPKILRLIFERLNSAGKPLRRADVFNALHGTNDKHSSNLESLSTSLKDMGFGSIQSQWLLKAFLAMQGLDITQDFKQQLREGDNLSEALLQAERVLRTVIVFIKRDAGIPHIQLLPYKLPLVLLARFFHLYPEPSVRTRELLTRWLWRGAIAEHHKGDNMAQVQQSLLAIGQSEQASIQKMLAQITPPASYDSLYSKNYDFGTARTKIQVNALLSLQPRNLLTGEVLDIPFILEHQGGSALLQISTAILDSNEKPTPQSKEKTTRPIMRGLANRIFHPLIRESSPLEKLSATPPLRESILESHALTRNALNALKKKDILNFLVQRKKFLISLTQRFLQSRARWEESDHGPIQSMIVSDEED